MSPVAAGSRALAVTDAALLVFALAMALSIAVSELALGTAIVAWLASRPWRRPQAPGVRALAWATAALAGSWLLASAFATAPLASLINARKLYAVVLVFLLADRGRDPLWAGRFAAFALAGGVAMSAYGALRMARSPHPLESWQGLEGVYANAMTSGNVLASLTLVALALALWAGGVPAGRRVLRLAALVVLFGSLVLTLRRSAWLAFAAGSLLLVAVRRARFLALVPLGLALALAVSPPAMRQRAALILDPTETTSAGRLSLWRSGWDAFVERPLTGHGLADMLELIARHRRPDATFEAGHFHNNWVQVAVATGAVGLLAYAAWMLLAGWLAWRALRAAPGALTAAGLAVWLGFQVHGLFDWSFGDAEVAHQFYAWLGLALAARAPAQGSR